MPNKVMTPAEQKAYDSAVRKHARATVRAFGKGTPNTTLGAYVQGPYEPQTGGWYAIYDLADKMLRTLAAKIGKPTR